MGHSGYRFKGIALLELARGENARADPAGSTIVTKRLNAFNFTKLGQHVCEEFYISACGVEIVSGVGMDLVNNLSSGFPNGLIP